MKIEDKYNRYLDFYNEYFIHEGIWSEEGNNIPASMVSFRNGESELVNMGDGTINLAHHLQFLFSRHLNGEDVKNKLYNSLMTISRLSLSASKEYKRRYPEIDFPLELGFFFRDDVNSKMTDFYHCNKIISAYTNSIERIDEDVTWSCYVSQDQLWNLAPALRIMQWIDEDIKSTSIDISKNLFGYVIDNNHVIYDPHASKILHYWKYIDFGEFSGRLERRDKSLKYKVKVKRGAYNWYFSYGFRKSLKILGNVTPNKFITFLSLLWYAPFTFLADKIYYPIATKLGVRRKDNSYHCLAFASDCWCGGDKFWKRLLKRVKDEDNEDYMWLLIPELIKKNKIEEIDIDWIINYLEDYPDPIIDGNMNNPLLFMTMYNYYKYIGNKV